MKVYTYSRVAMQVDDRIVYQQKNLEQFCAQQGFDVIASYSDIAPDHLIDRPGLEQMLASLEAVEGVIVYSMDRLTRSPDQYRSICDRLKQQGVKLIALL